jgi:hypothetical protein
LNRSPLAGFQLLGDNFLNRHPKKMILLPIVAYAFLKARLTTFVGKVFRLFFPKLN